MTVLQLIDLLEQFVVKEGKGDYTVINQGYMYPVDEVEVNDEGKEIIL